MMCPSALRYSFPQVYLDLFWTARPYQHFPGGHFCKITIGLCFVVHIEQISLCFNFVLNKNTVFPALGKNCVRICIQNLLQISTDVSGPLLAEVAVAVFSFIRDTYSLNAALFTEFDTYNGYQALENILKR